jgi:hypothetical protein
VAPVPLDPEVELALHRMRWRRAVRAELDFRLHPVQGGASGLVDYRRVILDLPADVAVVQAASLGRAWWAALLAAGAAGAATGALPEAHDVKLVSARFLDAGGELCRLDWDDEAGGHVLDVLGHRRGVMLDPVRDELLVTLLAAGRSQ